MLKVISLFALVLIAGNLASAFTPATSQDITVVGDTISPMSMQIPANLPIESYQAV